MDLKYKLICVLLAVIIIGLIPLGVKLYYVLDQVGTSSENTSKATYNLSQLTYNANNLVVRWDKASSILLDCKVTDPKTGKITGNPACLPSTVLAIAGLVKQGAKAIPQISNNIGDAANNVGRLTNNLSYASSRVSNKMDVISDSVVELKDNTVPILTSSDLFVKNVNNHIDELVPPIKTGLFELSGAASEIRGTTADIHTKYLPALNTISLGIGNDMHGITTNTNRWVENVTKPKRWYEKAAGIGIGVGTVAAKIYF